MADDVQTKKMAGESTTPPLGDLGILKESLQILARNAKLMVSITLFAAVPFCLITVVRDLIITPLESDFSSKIDNLPKIDPNSPEAQKIIDQSYQEIAETDLFEAVSIIVTYSVLFFSVIAAIYLSAMTYTGKHLTLKELILRIRSSWKRPLITALLVFLLTVGYVEVAEVLNDHIITTTVILLAVPPLLVTLPASVLYAYLSTIWRLGLVISVVEEDCYGMKALAKAGEIIKGRKVRGFQLMLLQSIVAVAIYLAYDNLCSFNISIEEQGVWVLVVEIIMVCLDCLMLILMCVVSTVFYFKCMEIINEETVDGMSRPIYSPVSTTED